jgi:aerobic carbon-monoxide dehydrogenase medium subunit
MESKMVEAYSFDYVRPTDWSQASRLLAEPGSVAKMGGCDVLMRHRSGRLQARLVVGLNKLPGVGDLTFNADGARIGSAITLAQLARSPQLARGWPTLAQTVGTIASPTIRTAATIVGNVAQGWPVSDIVPLLQIYEADLEIRGPAGSRRITVVEYASTPGTAALRPGEAIAALNLKPVNGEFRVVYERFAVKQAFALPLVSVAVGAARRNGGYGDVRVAAVGGSPTSARCGTVEAALSGSRMDEKAVNAAAAAMKEWAKPRSDHRASADYRRHLLTVLLRRTLSNITI